MASDNSCYHLGVGGGGVSVCVSLLGGGFASMKLSFACVFMDVTSFFGLKFSF